MSSRTSASVTPRSGPVNASKEMLTENCIRRIAIEPSIALGSFYDARTESVVGHLLLNSNVTKKVSGKNDAECEIMKADTFHSGELFRKIGIYEEPWLNSILNIVPTEGITSIINYSFPESTNIRFFYYYYSSEEQLISLVRNTVTAAIPKENPNITATHVVSAIKSGIQALIVLQLPPDDEIDLGSLLEDIAQRLPNARFRVSRNEKLELDRIIVTKILSNIPTLNNVSSLADICQKLTEIKPHIHRHRPLEFTLRKVKWFYPSYPDQKAQYIPLEHDVVKTIKQYLGLLSSQIKQLNISLNSVDKQTRDKSLEEQYETLRQRVADVEAMYPTEVEQLRKLVIKIRSGTITEQESIIEKLSDKFTKLLKDKIDPIIQRFESLKKKESLLKKLHEKNIKYLNMQRCSMRKDDDLNTIFQKLWTDGKPQLIFCSTDDFKSQDSSIWHDQQMKWMQAGESDSELTLVYADFTDTLYPLPKVKILLIKSRDTVECPFESSNLPLQSTSANPKSEGAEVKETKNLEEQSKQTDVSMRPLLEVSKDSEDSSKQVKRETSPENKRVNKVNELSSQQTSTPAVTPRKTKQSKNSDQTNFSPPIEKIESSNEQSNHKETQDNTSLPTTTQSPRVSSRRRPQDSEAKNPLLVVPESNSSTTKALSASDQQLDDSSKYNEGLKSQSSVPATGDQILSDGDNVKKEQSESLSSAISSAPAPVEASNKNVTQGESTDSEATVPDVLKTTKRSSQDSPLITSINEEPKSLTPSGSDVNLTVDQNNKDKRSSLPAEPCDLLDNSKNQSRPSTAPTPQDFPRDRRRSRITKEQSNTRQSHSDILLAWDQDNEVNGRLLNKSNPSMQIDSRNESLTKQLDDSLNDSNSQTRPSSAPISRSNARIKRHAEMTRESNRTKLSNSSAIEKTALPKRTKNDDKELGHVPKLLYPRGQPEKPKEPPLPENPSEPIIATELSSLEKPPAIIDERSNLPKIQDEPQTPPRLKTPDTSSESQPIRYINVLLLGESGVGKSTFINALVNYLGFESLEQARLNQPLVAMPVSFLMTVGDNFDEQTVQFGAKDLNEDHDHPGQSVTQHCRSYVFRIGTKTNIRIIDTPGMGDTRGIDQDDRNMEHILSFINNLPHLDAICILLKPNESRLQVVLRSYFTRFLNFLGENARNNIIFCFTNTRATFYAPGNTAPLLRKMISSLPIKDIRFEKRNTFCFDSESFRYLVALQNDIPFDTVQENDYQQSWTKSSTVSRELIQYICEELKPYTQSQWQSIEHARFNINQLIRPMLEAMRNTFRNITLLKENSADLLIELHPSFLSQSSALCYKCPRTPERFSNYWILPDTTLHTFSNECQDCNCSKKKHVNVDYKLDYGIIPHKDAQDFGQMKLNIEQLRMGILEFSQFYAYIIDTLKQDDPILSALKRIITEENKICSEKGDKCLNVTLCNLFNRLTKEYEERRSSSISIHLPVDLSDIYEHIRIISKIDEVKKQMDVIQEAQRAYLKQHEKKVF